MKTEILKIRNKNPEISKIRKAAKIIKNGGIVIFPTETVYGIGADALNPEAVKKIFKIKNRPSSIPLTVHIAELEILYSIVEEVPDIVEKLVRKFWPGPLTIILKKKKIIPDIVTGYLPTVGIRMPSNEIALSLIKEAKTPVAAPSANIFSHISGISPEDVIEEFSGKVDLIIDGGTPEFGIESTVLDLTKKPAKILRPGALTKEELEKYLEVKISKNPKKYKVSSSEKTFLILVKDGSPEKVLKILEKYKNRKVGILTYEENKKNYENFNYKVVGSKKNYRECAKNIYKILREFAREKYEVIIAEGIKEEGFGLSIMDRLKKIAKIIC